MRVQAEAVEFVQALCSHSISDGKVFSGKSEEILKVILTGRSLSCARRANHASTHFLSGFSFRLVWRIRTSAVSYHRSGPGVEREHASGDQHGHYQRSHSVPLGSDRSPINL